jgi:hypothetical protein
MLIEPQTHIQWQYNFSDDKLNVIETRQQRLNFITNLADAFNGTILRGIDESERVLRVEPGEQKFVGDEQLKDTFFYAGNLERCLKSQRNGCQYQLLYAQSLEISNGVFRNLNIVSDYQSGKIIMRLTSIEDT